MIKKVLSAALVLAACVTLNAQEARMGTAIPAAPGMAAKPGAGIASVTIDTLKPASVMASGCGLTTGGIVYYGVNLKASNRGTVNDSGFYFGTCKFPQAGITVTGLAQKYNIGTSSATVTNVLVLAGKGKGSTTTTMATIYNTDPTTKAPTTVLGTSTALPMSSYSATGYTSYMFSTPVTVPAGTEFAAGISVPAFGGTDKDTVAILTTKGGCSSTDSLSWIQLNGSTWLPETKVFGKAFNLDLMIFPVIDIASGIDNYVSKGGLQLFAPSPNPASNSVNISFSLNQETTVGIEVYDITGKVVLSFQASDKMAAGRNNINLNVNNLLPGTYIYGVNAGGNKMFSRFIITK
ncbi:MAG TPA: T9SS type A sorting domain-containing protein [Bacteroidia bacterium]|nr:T9SS type A sorting domain-containing protein [Bacteroidia bacterium]